MNKKNCFFIVGIVASLVIQISGCASGVDPTDNVSSTDETTNFADIKIEDIDENTSEPRDGYEFKEIEFSWEQDDGTSKAVKIGIVMPEKWTVTLNTEPYSVVPYAQFGSVADGETGVGGIGFLPYEIPDGTELIPEAVFSQLTNSSMVMWDVHNNFEVVSEDDDYCTALTKVYYSDKLFEDKKERTNNAIVSYHKKDSVYIAFEIKDGSTDREVLSQDELKYIAESIVWKNVE